MLLKERDEFNLMGSLNHIAEPPSEALLSGKRFESLEGLRRLGRIVAEEVLRSYRPDSCIASTKIVIAVLAHYGIKAVPLPVQVAVYNAAFNLSVKRMRQLPREDPVSRARIKRRADDAFSLVIGYGSDIPNPAGWDGHLVAWIPSRQVIIDASIGQGNRPQRGINLPRCLLLQGADVRFTKGIVPLCAKHDGSVLRYDAAPNNLEYIDSPDWSARSGRQYEIFANTIGRSIAALDYNCEQQQQQARHRVDESVTKAVMFFSPIFIE